MGTMPPETDFASDADQPAPLSRPKPDEIAAIRNWITAGAPHRKGDIAARGFLNDIQVLKLIADDLRGINARQRRFIRYFTIVHLFNSGYNADQLQTYRAGLSKLVNSLSWGRKIVVPVTIDKDQTILRIDLRDYLWTEDVWRAIVERNPYGAILDNSNARSIQTDSGSELPFVRADWFVHAASRPPLYHEVLQLPDKDRELEWKLNVDVLADIRQEKVARAGFNQSGISRNNRVIERHESSDGVYWKSYDFAGNADRRNLFAKPLGPGDGPLAFEHDGGEIIYSLPNGLQAYLLVNGQGERLDKAPPEIVRDARQADGAVVNGISCMSCHNRGLIEKADQVREIASRSRAFSKEDHETIDALYPPKDKFEALIRDDINRFARAVKATGASLSQTEPVFALASRFEDDLDLRLAAAESGLPTDELRDMLGRAPELGQALGPLLVGGKVKRDVFVNMFPVIAEARHLTMLESRAPERVASNSITNPPRGPIATGRWFVLFRGRDPRAWNTRREGDTFAIPVIDAPEDTRFLRLTRKDTGEALIVPIIRDGLTRARTSRDDPFAPRRWCGTNEDRWGGLHLGIGEGPLVQGSDNAGRGKLAVQVEWVDFFVGSGFGHEAHGDGRTQHFGWRGQKIPPTDFEIAVTNRELTGAERALLDPAPSASTVKSGTTTKAGSRSVSGLRTKVFTDDQLFALPQGSWANGPDRFREIAPVGSVLVGFNVAYVNAFGGTMIGGIQPVFRNGTAVSTGVAHGGSGRFGTSVVAKPGFAVGGIRMRTGLILNGFEVVFMRLKGDRLDPTESYTSAWLGDDKGGSPGTVSSDGKVVVGIHGRSGKEVNSLGLIILR
jgi:hypothetical protein